MKHFKTYICEFLVNNHTTKLDPYLADNVMNLLMEITDKKYVEVHDDITSIHGNPVNFKDGRIRPWVYIWKYIYDNPRCSIPEVVNNVNSILKKIGFVITISDLTVNMLITAGNFIATTKDDLLIALEPNDWHKQ